MEIIQKNVKVIKERGNHHYEVVTDDDLIKKLYSDTNYQLRVEIVERKLTYVDDVLILKKSNLFKTRREGKKFFSKKLEVYYLKIDFNSGNFLTLYSFGGIKRKRHLTIRRNCFDKLHEFFDLNTGSFWGTSYNLCDATIHKQIVKCFKEHYYEPFGNKGLSGVFNRIFIDKKGIKVPNHNVDRYLTRFYPTQKFLKKNNNKLIQSMLDYMGIKDSYTTKLVHKIPDLDFRLLKVLHHILGGSKYLSNVDASVFNNIDTEYNDNHKKDPNLTKFTIQLLGEHLKELTKLTNKEKGNLVKVINDMSCAFGISGTIPWHMFMDHLRMMDKIRPYDPNISLRSTTYRTFTEEHTELSENITKIRRGYVVSYKFHPLMVNDIETPLGLNGEYVPYILKDENDYTEEGSFMKHCVGSYYDKDKSIIISIRNGDDRWTSEFDTENGNLIQCMGKQNSNPPTHIRELVENNILKKTRTWSSADKLKSVEKIVTPLKINGKEIDVIEHQTHDMDLPF